MSIIGSGPSVLFIILGVLIVSGLIVGLALLITSLARRKENQQAAQPQTVPAQVYSRRMVQQQSTPEAPVYLLYCVTFLKGDGTFVEFAVDPQQYALLTEGTCGALTFCGPQYLGFSKQQ